MDEISVKRTEPMTVVFLAKRGPYSQIPEGFGRLYHWLQAAGHQATGMPHVVYTSAPETPQKEARWELWAPVAETSRKFRADSSGLGVKSVEPELVASVVHKGPYDQAEQAYRALMRWVEENGYEVAGAYRELYLNDPSTVPPEEYLTEMQVPVRKK